MADVKNTDLVALCADAASGDWLEVTDGSPVPGANAAPADLRAAVVAKM